MLNFIISLTHEICFVNKQTALPVETIKHGAVKKTHIYSSQLQTAISQLDKLLFEELSVAANSCLPLMREVGSRQAARKERKPKDTVFVG